MVSRMCRCRNGSYDHPGHRRQDEERQELSPVTMPRALRRVVGQLGEDQPLDRGRGPSRYRRWRPRARRRRCGSCGGQRGAGDSPPATFREDHGGARARPAPRGEQGDAAVIQGVRFSSGSRLGTMPVIGQREDHRAPVGRVVLAYKGSTRAATVRVGSEGERRLRPAHLGRGAPRGGTSPRWWGATSWLTSKRTPPADPHTGRRRSAPRVSRWGLGTWSLTDS